MIPVIANCPPGTMPYVIKAGDTFYSIAHRFNTTVQALIAANPTVNPNMLMIGQQICIPRRPSVPTCPVGTAYTIKAGDTFYSIAMAHSVSVDELLRFNPGVDPNRLYIGQVICIPPRPIPLPTPTCPAGTLPYTIQAGDTFFAIAQRYGVTVEALLIANPTVNPNALYIGQLICIPPRPTPPPPPSTCPTGTFAYTIVSGDTYYRLAIRYNTTIEAITAANPSVNPNALQIGQIICIPGTPTPPPPPPTTCPTGTFAYTIVSGDTYFRLAQRYNTTVEAIRSANPNVNPDALQIGQRICIPGTPTPPPPTCPAGTMAHTVRSGDTYYRLAIQHNTTVEAIRSANPGVDPDNLRVGQIICIPHS